MAFTLTKVQQDIFLDRYAIKGFIVDNKDAATALVKNGEMFIRYGQEVQQDESAIEEMWNRVALGVAELETTDKKLWEDNFYKLLYGFAYVPGGRILAALGSGANVTAQNCYVIPSPEDSRHGILDSFREWVEIQSKGGGVGINISSLRPRGEEVKSVNGHSSGPVNWSQLFSFVSKEIIIQGGSRRGAAMIMMNDHHPDIEEFIHAKETPGILEGCNISVCISNAFMEAVKGDKSWDLHWGGKVYRTVQAKDIWNQICEAAWQSGEPGVYFLERANDMANSAYFEQLIATNPCGEQPLGPYGACLLGSLNLDFFMVNDPLSYKKVYFDFDKLADYTKIAVRFNDNIVDLSHYPLPECEDSQKRIRRMGIGVMGLADVLIKQGVRYGSPDAIEFTEKVFKTIAIAAYDASADLAKERGAFPEFSAEYVNRPFIQKLPEWLQTKIQTNGIRNCYLMTQAPTGTIALLSGVNGGIEPYFDFDYQRSDRIGEYDVVSRWASEYASVDRPNYLVIADDVTPEEHVLMQAAAQNWNDSSISKTVNAPNKHSIDDVKAVYLLAWEKGLKSIAYYRDGSRNQQVLNHKKEVVEELITIQHKRRKLPDTRNSKTYRFKIDGQSGYIHVGLYEDGTPGEIFLDMSKAGSSLAGLLDWGATMASFALQHGASIDDIAEKMIGTQFEPSGFTVDPDIPNVTSILDYVGRKLLREFQEGYADYDTYITEVSQELKAANHRKSGILCRDCGREMYRAEGCLKCICGNSKC
jgi:ribonucleoside-diphosphate reductase alpha chain